MIERILNLIAPHYCIVCGSEGAVVCEWCMPDFVTPLPSRCYICKVATKDFRVCRKCRTRSVLKHVWVSTIYEGQAKELVQDFKFKRKKAASEFIARKMTETLPYFDTNTVLTHVPTATDRVRQRGYDHAELIACNLARLLCLRYEALLFRVTKTRQVGASRKERYKQMENAFAPRKKIANGGARILLVDDLVTTGATLESAARCLQNYGANEVSAVVFAQR